MDTERNGTIVAEALARYQAGRISRRTLARVLGGLGLTGAAADGIG